MAEGQPLFSQFEIRDILQVRERSMYSEIESVDTQRLLNLNPETLVDYFVEKYMVAAPVLQESEIEVADEETKINMGRHPNARLFGETGDFYVPGVKITYFVPFEGDPNIFRSRGSQISFSPPRAVVEESELRLSYSRTGNDPEAVKREFERDMNQLRGLLGNVTTEIQVFNSTLPGKAEAALSARRERLRSSSVAVATLGYPLRRREGAPKTYAVPEVRRKISTRTGLPQLQATALEPAVSMENYEHILSVLQNMVLVIERSPGTFAGMREEDIRNHFLVQLNGHYEGQATGETFNGEGKTDILVRAEGRNIFIAECKFWKGEKSFHEAIDQLMGYLTWRDTKAAIIVFNRNKNLSTTLEAIRRALTERKEVLRVETQTHETVFRAHIHRLDDVKREMIVTILVFEVPVPEKETAPE